jgi:hypothetical protein
MANIEEFQRQCELANSIEEREGCKKKTETMLQRERSLLEEMVIVRSDDYVVRSSIAIASFSLGLIYAMFVFSFAAFHWKSYLDWKLLTTCGGVAFICAVRIAYTAVVIAN